MYIYYVHLDTASVFRFTVCVRARVQVWLVRSHWPDHVVCRATFNFNYKGGYFPLEFFFMQFFVQYCVVERVNFLIDDSDWHDTIQDWWDSFWRNYSWKSRYTYKSYESFRFFAPHRKIISRFLRIPIKVYRLMYNVKLLLKMVKLRIRIHVLSREHRRKS